MQPPAQALEIAAVTLRDYDRVAAEYWTWTKDQDLAADYDWFLSFLRRPGPVDLRGGLGHRNRLRHGHGRNSGLPDRLGSLLVPLRGGRLTPSCAKALEVAAHGGAHLALVALLLHAPSFPAAAASPAAPGGCAGRCERHVSAASPPSARVGTTVRNR